VPTYSGTATSAINYSATPYTITSVIGAMSAANYTFASANGNLTITKALLTVTYAPKTKTYDGGLYTDSFNSTLGGLTAEYYRNKDLTGSPHIKRVDSTIDNNWGGGGPTGLGVNDRFSVRWTGSVLPQYTQTYTFTTRTDDGVRLWVNGILLINRWRDFAPTNHSGNIALVAGQYASIKMEYYENGGGAVAQLF
jgi:hypothetical protein